RRAAHVQHLPAPPHRRGRCRRRRRAADEPPRARVEDDPDAADVQIRRSAAPRRQGAARALRVAHAERLLEEAPPVPDGAVHRRERPRGRLVARHEHRRLARGHARPPLAAAVALAVAPLVACGVAAVKVAGAVAFAQPQPGLQPRIWRPRAPGEPRPKARHARAVLQQQRRRGALGRVWPVARHPAQAAAPHNVQPVVGRQLGVQPPREPQQHQRHLAPAHQRIDRRCWRCAAGQPAAAAAAAAAQAQRRRGRDRWQDKGRIRGGLVQHRHAVHVVRHGACAQGRHSRVARKGAQATAQPGRHSSSGSSRRRRRRVHGHAVAAQPEARAGVDHARDQPGLVV
ncbi:hypothetical protein IWQ56_007149, partial [Coemansia nantahalensis]